MKDEKVKLIIGALLHDIGKVVYRQGQDGRKHSQSGYDYLKGQIGIDDREILDCVRYHHADELKNAAIEKDSFAYIVYIADNIASAVDRREKEEKEQGFQIHTTLQPVFNLLNGNHENMYYKPMMLNPDGEINNPISEQRIFDEVQYHIILQNISDNLKGIAWDSEYINSLLEVLEANLSFVPSSTSKQEVADISLYDHLKLTAAVASCIYTYLSDENQRDYKEELFSHAKDFYDKKAFLLASLDVSGIQKFIYTISTKNALKTLRSRSFYLEIMMEHIIDMLLQDLELSRANLIYAGGGHCYLLLPNTQQVQNTFHAFLEKINQWYMQWFQISLYIAGGYVECSCNQLNNVPNGSYSELFKTMSKMISERKGRRYSANDIRMLNQTKASDYGRECNVCKQIGHVNNEGRCEICEAIEKFSAKILKAKIFTVTLDNRADGLPLPGNCKLITDTEESLRKRMADDAYFVRAYGKNKMYTGKHVATKLWVGDYTNGSTFEELANSAKGIHRIAILRADVDNLGHAIVAGFDNPENNNRYVTLSRTATLSRQLSLFFKLYINKILEEPQYTIGGIKKDKRKATIVYSGGDDVFIAGAWDDVIELAIDLRHALESYTENTLTISAGIGIYQHTYPISVSAQEVAEQEEKSKHKQGKNAVTLLEDGAEHKETTDTGWSKISDGTYSWQEFEEEVIGEKFIVINQFFQQCEDRGKSLLYKMLELIRTQTDKINFARIVYLIARLEPNKEATEKQKKLYMEFSSKMYQWLSTSDKQERDRNCRQLKTAITLYAYLMRETEE